MKKRVIRAICIALVFAMFVTLLTGCGFTYAEGNLEEYLTLDITELSEILVVLSADYEVTDEKVEDAIRSLLHGEKTAVSSGMQETEKETGEGDVVAFYYTMVNAAGQVYTDGFSVGDQTPYLLEIGNTNFPLVGVEEALTAIRPANYKLVDSGTVQADSLIYMEYYYEDKVGDTTLATTYYPGMRRIPLMEADELLGTGFASHLTGSTVGLWQTFDLTGDYHADGTVVTRTYHVNARYVSRGEITVTSRYGEDYVDEERAGKTVTLYLQPVYLVDYEVPTLTAETVTEIFELFKDSTDPVADFRAQVRQTLLTDETRSDILASAVMEQLLAHTVVHSLPQKKVKKLVSALKSELNDLYEYSLTNLYDTCVAEFGEAAMTSLDGFARAVYDGENDEDVDAILTRVAKEEVMQYLVVYTVARRFGLLPDSATLETGSQIVIDDYLSGEESLTEKKLIRRYGGREYFEALYCRAVVLSAISERVNVEYISTTSSNDE